MPSEAWRNRQLVKDLAVVGHGRGATSYAAAWLRAQGVRVDHERIGPQGIVESGFSVPTWGVRAGVNQGLTRDAFLFKHKVCILRDPHKVIGTYEQIEHPRAIFAHADHLPGMLDDLLPAKFFELTPEKQMRWLEDDRQLRVNAIARSVVRWTQEGIDWCNGDAWQAEGEWAHRMPDWLECRGLWPHYLDVPNEVPPNTVNHRKGMRLHQQGIDQLLHSFVRDELYAYRRRVGYDG